MTETPMTPAEPKRKWPVWLTVVLILIVVCCCCVALASAVTALWTYGDTWFGLASALGQLLAA